MKKLILFAILGMISLHLSAQICIEIGEGILHRTNSAYHGNWCRDPLQTDGAGKVYVFPSYYGSAFYEYPSLTDYQNNTNVTTHTLSVGYEGTGQVVYDGYLYYNMSNSNHMIKFDISTGTIVLDIALPNAGFHNIYCYDWGGWSDIDFAVDETGLWVVYSTSANAGKAVIINWI